MPDSLECPWTGRSVVPLVRAGFANVSELIAYRLPGFTAVVRALDQLAKPSAALRQIEPIRVGGRSFHMINLPACEERTLDLPLLTFAVRCHYECAFACANQYSHLTHFFLLLVFRLTSPSMNLGNNGVVSSSRQRRRTSARNASRSVSISASRSWGAAVCSYRAAQMSKSSMTGARSIPFSVSR